MYEITHKNRYDRLIFDPWRTLCHVWENAHLNDGLTLDEADEILEPAFQEIDVVWGGA